jgi:hypothetical protein
MVRVAAPMEVHAKANGTGQLDAVRELWRDRTRIARAKLHEFVEWIDESQRERAFEHFEPTPHARLGSVVVEQPRRRGVTVEDLRRSVGLESLGPLAGDAAPALDRPAHVLGSALRVLDPGEARQRRPMPDVTAVPAVEQGDPVVLLVSLE